MARSHVRCTIIDHRWVVMRLRFNNSITMVKASNIMFDEGEQNKEPLPGLSYLLQCKNYIKGEEADGRLRYGEVVSVHDEYEDALKRLQAERIQEQFRGEKQQEGGEKETMNEELDVEQCSEEEDPKNLPNGQWHLLCKSSDSGSETDFEFPDAF